MKQTLLYVFLLMVSTNAAAEKIRLVETGESIQVKLKPDPYVSGASHYNYYEIKSDPKVEIENDYLTLRLKRGHYIRILKSTGQLLSMLTEDGSNCAWIKYGAGKFCADEIWFDGKMRPSQGKNWSFHNLVLGRNTFQIRHFAFDADHTLTARLYDYTANEASIGKSGIKAILGGFSYTVIDESGEVLEASFTSPLIVTDGSSQFQLTGHLKIEGDKVSAPFEDGVSHKSLSVNGLNYPISADVDSAMGACVALGYNLVWHGGYTYLHNGSFSHMSTLNLVAPTGGFSFVKINRNGLISLETAPEGTAVHLIDYIQCRKEVDYALLGVAN